MSGQPGRSGGSNRRVDVLRDSKGRIVYYVKKPKRPPIVRVCTNCGKEFVCASRVVRRCCSLKCANEAQVKSARRNGASQHAALPERTCIHCGSTFRRRKKGSEKADSYKYCSRSCAFTDPNGPFRSRTLAKLAKLEFKRQKLIERKTGRERLVVRQCSECGSVFRATNNLQKTCGTACGIERRRRLPYRTHSRICAKCQKPFRAGRRTQSLCVLCSQREIRRRRRQMGLDDRGKHAKRAKRAGVPYVRGISGIKVFRRDGWRCHICKQRTPKHLQGKNQPRSPELDHIIPISQGGSHTWDNVACACRECNGRKSNRILGQLRLSLDANSNITKRLAGAS